MKKNLTFKLLQTLFLSFVVFVSNSQDSDYEAYDNWILLEGPERFIMFNYDGKIIDNATVSPTLVIDVLKDNDGSVGIRLNQEDIYRYNEDKNYIQLDFIVDDSEVFGYTSRVVESSSDDWETEIKLTRMEGEPSLFDLFDLMKKGQNIYVQTTGAGDPKVWSFELDGFSEGYNSIFNKWNEWKQKQKKDNPFKKKDDNPFRR